MGGGQETPESRTQLYREAPGLPRSTVQASPLSALPSSPARALHKTSTQNASVSVSSLSPKLARSTRKFIAGYTDLLGDFGQVSPSVGSDQWLLCGLSEVSCAGLSSGSRWRRNHSGRVNAPSPKQPSPPASSSQLLPCAGSDLLQQMSLLCIPQRCVWKIHRVDSAKPFPGGLV